MKTNNKLNKIIALLSLLLLASACGKSKSTSGDSQAATGNDLFHWDGDNCINEVTDKTVASTYCKTDPFYLNGSSCIDGVTGSTVSSVYCENSSNNSTSGYYYSGGNCYSYSTNQLVNSSYCSSSYSSNQCVGYYYFMGYGYPMLVQCNGANCSGYTLYQYTTYQPVICG